MSKITYTDKVALNENPNVADVYKVKADDLNEIKNVVNANDDNLNNLQDQLLDIFYPIGSYYETSNTSFDPNVSWRGTWVKDSKGRVTVALNDSDADFNTISKTGGEKTHKLTINEMPSHTHEEMAVANPNTGGPGIRGTYNGQEGRGLSGFGTEVQSGISGGNQPHNNLQPYIVVVRWHRTA